MDPNSEGDFVDDILMSLSKEDIVRKYAYKY